MNSEFKLSNEYMHKMGQSFMDANQKPLLNMYVDMSMIFDYRLTALMAITSTQKEIDYIISRLKTYREYKGRKITKCFPSLKFSEDQLDEFLNDPVNINYLSSQSIVTNLSNLIPAKLMFFQLFNSSTPVYMNEPIVIQFVNKYFLPTKEVMDKWFEGLKKINGNIKVKFKKQDILKENPPILKNQDLIMLDDMQAFTQEGCPTYKMLLQDKAFLGRMIVASYRLDDDAPWMSDEGKARLDIVEKQLSPFTFFQFMDKLIPEPERK